MANALVFGGGGQIGAACAEALRNGGFDVTATGRQGDEGAGIAAYDPLADKLALPGDGPFDAVVWAQGANLNDSILDFDADRHRAIYDANVMFVLESLHALVASDRLGQGARLCVISSVWQTAARPNKLSYMVSKAALQGLVLSAATDLADRGILVNAVLPGALDTPMTRQNLTPEQIGRIADMTKFDRLPALGDVAALVAFLCSAANTSITGQFVAVDLGFQNARLV
jgi:NAD(P)-dependent dehydrogenase (short-subunit alcohol dehydrogenase family)